jgi:hypothetical protein
VEAQHSIERHGKAMSTKNEYMLLFVGNEWYNELSHAEIKKIADQAKTWLDGLMERGCAKIGHGLARDGARVAAKTGRVITDGPFAETKEAIGGYLIVEAGSLEEAIAIAKTNPTISYGTTIEIRPVNRGIEDCPLYRRLQELEQEPATAQA